LTCPKIAVVRVLDGIDTKTADEIAERLYAYRDDPNVAGVVLRVQSPGGDPVAADTIRNAVLRCKEKKEVSLRARRAKRLLSPRKVCDRSGLG